MFQKRWKCFCALITVCLPSRKQISQYLNIPNENTNQHTYPRTHMWTLQTQTHPDQTRATKTLNGNEKDKDWCLCLFIYFLYLNLLVSIRSEWHWMAIFWCSYSLHFTKVKIKIELVPSILYIEIKIKWFENQSKGFFSSSLFFCGILFFGRLKLSLSVILCWRAFEGHCH